MCATCNYVTLCVKLLGSLHASDLNAGSVKDKDLSFKD